MNRYEVLTGLGLLVTGTLFVLFEPRVGVSGYLFIGFGLGFMQNGYGRK